MSETNNLQKLIELCETKFDTKEHKTRTQGGKDLTYLSIDSVINRLNRLSSIGYSWDFTDVKHETKTIINQSGASYDNSKDKQLGYVIVMGTLRIRNVTGDVIIYRDGVGSDKWHYYTQNGKLIDDLDKSIKTAYAEAIKKASNTLGIGLYLWNEEERNLIEAEQKSPTRKKINYTEDQKKQMSELMNIFNLGTDFKKMNRYVEYWGKHENNNCKTFMNLNEKIFDQFYEFIKKEGHNVVPF